jgi:hypothetical protein
VRKVRIKAVRLMSFVMVHLSRADLLQDQDILRLTLLLEKEVSFWKDNLENCSGYVYCNVPLILYRHDLVMIRESIKLLCMMSGIRDFSEPLYNERHTFLSLMRKIMNLKHLDQWTDIAEQAYQLYTTFTSALTEATVI